MSSAESYLDLKKPKRPGEFTFTWSIQNYSYCTKKENELLESPEFVVEFLGDEKWQLWLYPKGEVGAFGFLTFYLFGNYQKADCNFRFSIRKTNGQFEEREDPSSFHSHLIGHNEFLGLEELKELDGDYLVDDTLTLRCRIWKTDVCIRESVNWNAHSRIRTSKLDYTWILNDIEVSNNELIISNQTKEITHFFVKIPSLKIHLIIGGHSGQDSIHFGIDLGERTEEFYFFICAVHLLDKNGQVAHSARGEHLFEDSKPDENWNFPLISKEKLYSNKNVYLHEGKLTLRCKFSFSSDNVLETFEYRKTNDIEKKPDVIQLDPVGQEHWIENMRACFLDGKFSDFIICTPRKQFPVHKAILSAHSEVFDAMLERDMKERNSGMVEIDDVDDGTVSQMLTFLYTNTIENLNCTSAQKLYFVADKYRIKPLQKKCSNHLMCGLDTSNVCDILELADRHQDQELIFQAKDFIEVHFREIIVSEGWKKLMETNAHLTTEVLQSIVFNKLL